LLLYYPDYSVCVKLYEESFAVQNRADCRNIESFPLEKLLVRLEDAMKYFRLGRVFGIDIHVNWSWLFIFGLVSWSLSLTFGQIHDEWPVNLRWGMAMLAAFLFFWSVLAHELAHSLVALARGVPVANITLFMFGGVSNMQREPSSPAEEMVITIVGPLMSLFLGACCLVAGEGGLMVNTSSLTAPALLAQLQPMNTTLAWLGSVNIMIGFFNLIPAFPLDGGRIVRSVIWAVLNDIRRSTRWATWFGQAIAWSMIVSGLVMVLGIKLPIVGDDLFNGLWLILIGVFLQNAAMSGYRQAVVEDRLASVLVRSVMQTGVPVILSNASLDNLLKRNLMQPDVNVMFVMENQEVIGLVAIPDVKKLLMDKSSSVIVRDVMTPISELRYVSADEDITDAFERLQRFDMRHIPVKFNNRVVGLLHLRDVHRWFQVQTELIS
jgi:Zn-dependent protease/CBS domain-containing protein